MNSSTQSNLAEYLLTTKAVRERSRQIYNVVAAGRGLGFRLNLARLDPLVHYVSKVILENYPDLKVPYHSRWRHLDIGNPSRLEKIFPANLSKLEKGRRAYDLVIPSILLDAGAGTKWGFNELGVRYDKSEGLAVASVSMFVSGRFSSDASILQTNAAGLQALTGRQLEEGMQVSPQNPLIGTEGRLALLQNLGIVLAKQPDIFGATGRLGLLFDHFYNHGLNQGGSLKASWILKEVLHLFGSIWPGRLSIQGINLGDTWEHSAIVGTHSEDHYVPFHKLSQWLSYSLIEPLEEAGILVVDLDDLTGLPEYRNGGLLLDSGVIELLEPEITKDALSPSHPLIVEWRALTICLLDDLAPQVIRTFKSTDQKWSLAKILQGGTWTAGRKIAREKRPDGSPPLKIASDGTVF